jgi:hypothetical protein
MTIQQCRDGWPNSAANPLPSPPNSAAGGPQQDTYKALISPAFLTTEGVIPGAGTGFSPAGRGLRAFWRTANLESVSSPTSHEGDRPADADALASVSASVAR